MQRPHPLVLAALILTACEGQGSSAEAAGAPAGAASPAATATASAGDGSAEATATADTDGARDVDVENDLYLFEYSWPGAAGRIPGLRDELDKRMSDARTELAARAEEERKYAAENDFPYRKHSSGTAWRVVTDMPGWLSLSAEGYTFSGGAHGMTFFDTLLWDKEANRLREPVSLFSSPVDLRETIRPAFCDLLDKERAKRRGGVVDRGSGTFNECIDPADSTVILGSSNGRTFDRIGVLVGPYAAGPYAEGTYEITLPVTRDIIDAVKPAYRDSFSIRR